MTSSSLQMMSLDSALGDEETQPNQASHDTVRERIGRPERWREQDFCGRPVGTSVEQWLQFCVELP